MRAPRALSATRGWPKGSAARCPMAPRRTREDFASRARHRRCGWWRQVLLVDAVFEHRPRREVGSVARHLEGGLCVVERIEERKLAVLRVGGDVDLPEAE